MFHSLFLMVYTFSSLKICYIYMIMILCKYAQAQLYDSNCVPLGSTWRTYTYIYIISQTIGAFRSAAVAITHTVFLFHRKTNETISRYDHDGGNGNKNNSIIVKVVNAVYPRVRGFRSHAEHGSNKGHDIRLYYYYYRYGVPEVMVIGWCCINALYTYRVRNSYEATVHTE